MNKASHPETRFQSTHGKVALGVYILIFIQWLVGLAQFFLPNIIFGSVDRAKSVYKYHRYVRAKPIAQATSNFHARASGYVLLVLFLIVVGLATDTAFNQNVLHIKLWAVVVASILVLVGLIPRIKKHKLGF